MPHAVQNELLKAKKGKVLPSCDWQKDKCGKSGIAVAGRQKQSAIYNDARQHDTQVAAGSESLTYDSENRQTQTIDPCTTNHLQRVKVIS